MNCQKLRFDVERQRERKNKGRELKRGGGGWLAKIETVKETDKERENEKERELMGKFRLDTKQEMKVLLETWKEWEKPKMSERNLEWEKSNVEREKMLKDM